MKYVIQTYGLCFPLTKKGWAALEQIEKGDGELEDDYTQGNDFIRNLEDLGASKIEWNGHFGRNIFLSVETIEQASAITAFLKLELGGQSKK